MKDTTILDDKVFEQLNMTDLTAEEKSNFSKNFLVALNARVNAVLVERMNEQQQEQYIRLIGEGDEKKIEQFKMKEFPDIRKIVDEQFEKLKAEIMSGAEQLSEGDEEVDTEPTQDVNPFFVDSKVPAPQPPPAITTKV
jgi:molybdenum cofactor biosynthesis enzyme MoaA